MSFGEDLDKVVEGLKTVHGGEFTRVSRDGWNVLLDEAENGVEASGKINMVHKEMDSLRTEFKIVGKTDVSGLGLAEQARMLTQPSPPKKEEEEEEELEEHAEM